MSGVGSRDFGSGKFLLLGLFVAVDRLRSGAVMFSVSG
jgi:hypothetical protein